MFLLIAGCVSAVLRGGRTARFSIEPELVANLLMDVEHQWVDGAASRNGAAQMVTSCSKVAASIIQGSDGERERVDEYFDTICNEKSFGTWERDLCVQFSHGIADFMGSDAEYNRDYLNVSKFCESFYDVVQGTAQVEEKRRDAARLQAVEDEKKKAEAAKKADAEAKKRREEDEKKKAEASKKAEAAKKESEKLRSIVAKKTEAASTAVAMKKDTSKGERSLMKARSEMDKAKAMINTAKRTSADAKEKLHNSPQKDAPHSAAPSKKAKNPVTKDKLNGKKPSEKADALKFAIDRTEEPKKDKKPCLKPGKMNLMMQRLQDCEEPASKKTPQGKKTDAKNRVV